MEKTANVSTGAPILFPYAAEAFWDQMRTIIREEMKSIEKAKTTEHLHHTPGLTYKPLYKMREVCQMFNVTRPTIYDWVKHGKLRPYKVRSIVYFLWNDVQELLGVKNVERV